MVFRLTWGRKATLKLDNGMDNRQRTINGQLEKGKNKKWIIDEGKYLTIESGSFPGCCPESWDMEVTVSWLLSFTEIRNFEQKR